MKNNDKNPTTQNESYWDAVEREERQHWEKRARTAAGQKELEDWIESCNDQFSPYR